MPKIKSEAALMKYRENLARIKHLKQQSLDYKDKASKLSKVSNSLSKAIEEAILDSDRELCSMHYMKKREKAIKPPGRPKAKKQTTLDLGDINLTDAECLAHYKGGELGHHSKQLLDECFTPTSNKQLFSPSDYKRIITEDEDEYEEPVFIKPSRKTKDYTSEELNEIVYGDGTSRLSAEEKFPSRYPKRYFKTGKTQKPKKSNPSENISTHSKIEKDEDGNEVEVLYTRRYVKNIDKNGKEYLTVESERVIKPKGNEWYEREIIINGEVSTVSHKKSYEFIQIKNQYRVGVMYTFRIPLSINDSNPKLNIYHYYDLQDDGFYKNREMVAGKEDIKSIDQLLRMLN